MTFDETYSDIKLRIPNEFFKETVANFLSNLTYNNPDKTLLDKISLNQILNASYVYGGSHKASIYSNYLCPSNIYELLNYTTWRLNSSESTISLIKMPLDQKEINLHIDLQFFTPNILRRNSSKFPDFPKEKKIPEDNNTELKEKSKIKLEETGDFVYEVDKICLGPLNYIHKKYDVKLILSEDKKDDKFPNLVKLIPLEIKEAKDKILHEFSVEELQRNYQIKIDREDIRFEIKLSLESINNISFNDPNYKYFLFKFKFKNRNEYTIKKKSRFKRRRIARDKVLRNSIICPLIKFEILNATLCRYKQQLKGVYEVIKTGDIQAIEAVFKNNLEKLKYFKQFNCVQTFSLTDQNQIFITPFGIFDNPREFPLEGPAIDDLLNFQDIIKNLTELDIGEINFLETKKSVVFNKLFSELLVLLFQSLKLYFTKLGIEIPRLWKFQWDNIQWRIQYLIKKFYALHNNQKYLQLSRIIKAPTGSGKTLIFFVDSILHYMFTGERIAIIFPTRILNIEMFQNLTLLIHCLRENHLSYDCGLFIGTRTFNLTQLNISRTAGSTFPLIPMCPKCLTVDSVEIKKRNIRKIGVCNKCNHEISYIYMPREVQEYLPIINIATPDKLFYEALNANYPYLSLRSFGAPVIKCPSCGRYNSFLKSEVQKGVNNDIEFVCSLKFPECNNIIDPKIIPLEYKPIGFIILDEIHSIYGFTGIVLTIFFRFLKIIHILLLKKRNYYIDFESGTATIANEQEFFKTLTTQEISSFPDDSEYFTKYFNYNLERVRYRIMVQSVIFTSVRNAFSRAIINDYVFNNISTEIENELNKIGYDPDAYRLLLGYLFRKTDGYTTSNSIYAFARDNPNIAIDLKPPIFISGDSSSDIVSQFLKHVNSKKIKCFLANLVISLGMNIKNLNNMILFAAPKAINEQVQTIGRLGRSNVPGHASILLMPNRPRDEFFYENFHQVLVDIKGYLELQPIQSTNLFISQMIVNNLIYSLMSGYMRENYQYCFRNKWPPFLEATKEGKRFYGIRKFASLLKKILYVDILQYKSLENNIEKIILEQLKIILDEMKKSTYIRWMGQYFKLKNRLLGGIRGTKDQIGIRVIEENLNFTESRTKMRFDTSFEEEGVSEIEEIN